MRDWEEIKKACVEDGESLRGLAARYQIPYSTLQRRAAREGWDIPKRRRDANRLKKEEFDRVGRKLLERIEHCLDEGKEIDLKELKAVTGALKELQTLDDAPEERGEKTTLTVRFVGEAEEMSK